MKREIVIKSPGKTIIKLNNESLTICRKGLLNLSNMGLKGDKTISFRNISAIQLKKPGLTNGYIQFTILGGRESRAGIFAATKDENTVMFSRKYYTDMLNLKKFIEHQQKSIFDNTSSVQISPADEVLKLKDLLDKNIITLEEFELKKKELLKL
ncbi:hypothetical protein EGW69_13660 [Enterococcus faecium]|uniref:DUF4429 domain-containing protein n=1 Tax=Enterococcus faecium TaxID=1352 RepID=UPI0005EAE696|nr:DUF4429 domain-containing protein [Enterococcus faecium]KNB95786.1 hypothetical protein LK34_01375 [Enterococcus faecium]PQG93574.1 hypothetical protein CUS55_10960 [Enterococcus faecium]RBS30086.1 hypothetical protein EB14_02413 [Enterococcus faecium]ROY77518.1 hypothetical protein EGW71_13745 [Enterococcus faecium]ROY77672.1 hypothetical protein EGW72_13745 [Enterococcus faecium]